MEYNLISFLTEFPSEYGLFSGTFPGMYNRGARGVSHKLVHEYSEDIIVAE